jgi:hypothetical protein
MEKKKMTKLLMVMMFVLSVLLVGCGSSGIQSDNLAKTNSEETESVDLFEKENENYDMKTLDSVASAFLTTLADKKVTESFEGTGSSMDESLRQEIEINLYKKLDEVESDFRSDACKGKELYFYCSPETYTLSVSVGTKEGCEGQYVDRFYISNR